MKKFCILFILLFIIILTVCLSATPAISENSEFLRVHIRAQSDLQTDQKIKYSVKDAVVDYLMPLISKCYTKEQAMQTVKENLFEIEYVANSVLKQNGYTYSAKATLKREEFPSRVYEGVTLQAGVYDALILELGKAQGANWWCVIYPPLCFAGETTGKNIVYRSAIYDIIAKFFE